MGNLFSSKGLATKEKLDSKDGQDLFTRKKFKEDNVESTDHLERSSSHTNIHELPPELLIEIFSWFSVRELCRTISPVCRIWHLISQHPGLWKHLSFTGRRITTERVCLILSHATQLRSLQLVYRVDVTAVLQQLALTNRQLKIIIVKRCVGSLIQRFVHEEDLLTIIRSCSKLVEITIKGTQFYSEAFLREMCIVLPHLKRINFNYNQYFGSRALNIIACNCKPLEELSVSWSCFREMYPNAQVNFINDNDINVLCIRMKNSLKKLRVVAKILTNNAMKSIAQCTYLHTLRILHGSELSDDGILELLALHNLTSLELSYALRVTSEGWSELFIRSNWKSLRKLSLNRCATVDDMVLEDIGENCPNLQKISLSCCYYFTEIGMSDLIRGCQKLIFLKIDFTEINVAQSFPLFPTCTPNLRSLVYERINRGLGNLTLMDVRQILHDLKNNMPNLEIRTSIVY